MEAKYQWLNSITTKNKKEFAHFTTLQWLNPYTAEEHFMQRNHLINKLKKESLFKGTKPYHHHISEGCQICGSGKWSCLFITNKCNANCFYCPTAQQNDEIPSTQGLEFDNPLDYAHYINQFDFKGVSFSGGEPLLFFERTISYLEALRKHCKPDLYVWLYTNGILVTEEKLRQLNKYGLNEIRFDIGATGFTLDKVQKAKGIIPIITIEIPAVPEEKERIIALLPEMIEAGVSNLNLHHLRLTQHNASKLTAHNYTILNAERPLVAESELAALEIANAAQMEGLTIGINYCSFHFKNRFQKAGYRRIIAEKIMPEACITENGYIRELTKDALIYKRVKLIQTPNNTLHSESTTIDGKIYHYSVITLFNESDLSAETINIIKHLISTPPSSPPQDPLLFKIWQLEHIEEGLRNY